MNININIDQYPDNEYDWAEVSCDTLIRMQDIINRPEYPSDWSAVSRQDHLRFHVIKHYPNKERDWTHLRYREGYLKE